MKKTNAMRILERQKIAFTTKEYEVDEDDLSGVHVAKQLGEAPEQVFKTLILRGEKNGYIVCCIPVNQELDLKKVARAAIEKSVTMLPIKELLPVTGYIRGGCSPVGMKKIFPTYIDETAIAYSTIYISAGIRGMQIILSPLELMNITNAISVDLIKS